MLKGVAASQGYGIGKAVVINDISTDYSNVKYTDAESEKARLQNAVDSFIEETKNLACSIKKQLAKRKRKFLKAIL